MPSHPLAPPIVAPSILSADFSRLEDALEIIDPERDWVHCDVMDNHFVPNLTFGPLIVAAVRKLTPAFIDVHLMIERPWELAAAFRKAGADQITLHLEACREPGVPLQAFDPARVSKPRVHEALAKLRATGARVGLAIKPATPFESAQPFLDDIDNLLVMTVEPGFGGQEFMDAMLPKLRQAVEWKRRNGARWLIEVDGGIDAETVRRTASLGAEVFVAGSAIFSHPDPEARLLELRHAVAAVPR